MPVPIRVLLIDDHPLFRRGVRNLLDIEDGFQVVAEANDGAEGILLAQRLQPDLILLDVFMLGQTGAETLAALRASGCDARVVMLTVSDSEADLVASLRAGADGYLLKSTEPEDLILQLKEILAGRMVLTQGLSGRLAQSLRRQQPSAAAEETALTARECAVLQAIGEGMNNKQIARKLNISEGTVKVHVKHVLKKLGVQSRLQAALWAVENPSLLNQD